MVAKDFGFNTAAQDGLLRGIEIVANTVKVTPGANDRKSYGAPRITKDGMTYIALHRVEPREWREHMPRRRSGCEIGESNDRFEKKFLELAEQYLNLAKLAAERADKSQ